MATLLKGRMMPVLTESPSSCKSKGHMASELTQT